MQRSTLYIGAGSADTAEIPESVMMAVDSAVGGSTTVMASGRWQGEREATHRVEVIGDHRDVCRAARILASWAIVDCGESAVLEWIDGPNGSHDRMWTVADFA